MKKRLLIALAVLLALSGIVSYCFLYKSYDISTSNIQVCQKGDIYYTGKEIKPSIVVTDKNNKIVPPNNYSLVYEQNLNYGIGRIEVVGKKRAYNSQTVTFNISKLPIEKVYTDSFKLYSDGSYSASFSFGSYELQEGEDYEIILPDDFKAGDKCSVRIKALNNLSGEKTVDTIVRPSVVKSLFAANLKQDHRDEYVLRWCSDDNNAKFEITKCNKNGGIVRVEGSTQKHEYTLKNLEQGVSNYFIVRACVENQKVKTYGEYSDMVSVNIPPDKP